MAISFDKLSRTQQGIVNDVGTEICGHTVDDVKAAFSYILEEFEREGGNRFI